MSKMELSPNMVRWLASGERGVSSETLFQTITGVQCLDVKWGRSHPYDPADLRRCMLLLEDCPAIAHRLDEMRKVSKEWNALIDSWDALTAMLREECPDWFSGKPTTSAKKTYDAMRSILDGARSKRAPA